MARTHPERQITRTTGKLTTIRALLERDPVCREIVCYFVDHSEAADTARGIAEWWVHRAVTTTADALSKLVGLGVVCAYPVQDSSTNYSFTKNPLLRQSLRHYVDETFRVAEAR